MALLAEKHRVVDGRTTLDSRFFNPLIRMLDSRLHDLEQAKIGWEEAIFELRTLGLLRINAELAPVLASAQSDIAERLEQNAAELAAHIAANEAALAEALASGVETINEAVAVLQSQIDDLSQQQTSFEVANILTRFSALSMTLVKDADGTLIAEQATTGEKIVYTRNAAGQLVSETYKDAAGNVLVTQTHSYDADGNYTASVWEVQ